jgi:hypothetical protein
VDEREVVFKGFHPLEHISAEIEKRESKRRGMSERDTFFRYVCGFIVFR